VRDLLIIGGGFYGVAAALEAQKRGLEVTVVDADHSNSGSRAAAGLIRGASPRVAGRAPAHWSWSGPNVDWLDARGLIRGAREIIRTYRKPDAREATVRLVEPGRILGLIEPERAQIQRLIRSTRGWSAVGREREGGIAVWDARRVLVTAGVWTDVLLSDSGLQPIGVTGLRGRAIILDQDEHLDPGVVLSWMTRPYTTWTMRRWGKHWRFGDSVERTDRAYLEMIIALRNHIKLGRAQLGELDGLRPVTERYFTELVAPGLVVSTGGHRSGLMIAGPAAERAMQLFSW
jgi:glycine/D-amino acid oxidase-like deaminating enzyme